MLTEQKKLLRNLVPYRPFYALRLALAQLVIAVAWAAFVAMTPNLSAAPGIPFIADNVVVSLPIAILWPILAAVFSKKYLSKASEPAIEGLKLGCLFALTGLFLDGVIVAVLVGKGIRHFEQAILWITYLLLILIPWMVGRRLKA